MKRNSSLLLTLIAVSACGGGGGSGGASPPPGGGGTPGIAFSTANAADGVVVGLALAEATVQLALAGSNPLVDLLESGLLQRTQNCSTGGSIETSIADNDSTNGLSAGDAVSVRWIGDCFSAELSGSATGTINLDIVDAWQSDLAELFIVANVAFSNFRVTDAQTIPASGSFRLELVFQNPSLEILQISMAGGDSVSLTVNGGTERVSNTSIRRSMTREAGTSDRPYSLSATLAVSSNLLGGSYNCDTRRVLTSPNALHEPLSGEFRCTASGGSAVRINSDRANRTIPVRLELDATGSGAWVELLGQGGSPLYWGDFLEGALFTERLRELFASSVPTAPVVTPLVVQLASNDMVYASGTDRIYATTDTALLEIDPDTLQVLRTLALAGTPGTLGMSGDEAIAWVALDSLSELQSVDLATMTTGASFALGDSYIAGVGPRRASRVRVAPGNNDLVVVGMDNATEMVAYSNGVALPNTIDDSDTSFSPPGSFLFRSSTSIVAQDTESTAYSVFRVTLDPATGLTVNSEVFGLGGSSYNRLKLGPQYVFASSGVVYDEIGESRIADLKPAGYFYDDLVLDNTLGIAVALSTSIRRYIDIIDTSSYALIGQYEMPPTTTTGRISNALLTNSSLVFAHGAELRRIDRAELITNRRGESCRKLDMSGILVSGTYGSLECGFESAIYDTGRNRIYAAVRTAHENGNSIAVVNPDSLVVESFIPLGTRAGQMALSADGGTILVTAAGANRILEVDLNSQSVTRETSLGIGTSGPNLPNSIAATKGSDGEAVVSYARDVSLYGNGALMGTAGSNFRAYAELFVSSDGALVFGRDSSTLDEFSVTSAGASFVQSHASAIYPRAAVERDDIIFGTDGEFFDIASRTRLPGCTSGGVPTISAARVGADQQSNNVYFAWFQQKYPGGYHLYRIACDASGLNAGSIVDSFVFGRFESNVINVLPVGGNRLAVLTNRRLLLVDRPGL
jgi:hypothetical protein